MHRIHYTLNNSEVYIETTNNFYPVRQIIIEADGRTVISARENILTESPITINEERHSIISEQEFDDVWYPELNKFKNEWEEIKNKYPIGTEISGVVQYFYPQGIICDIDGVLSITTDEAYTPEDEAMPYPGDVYEGIVSDYDEEHMWLVFKSK